ncbi:MAG TPA: protein kinase, partial [Kofleriaceae bacterium]
PMYMSPEQAAGQHIAAPCDIYSLGVIAYEALTGQPPFDGRTLAEVVCKHITSKPAPITDKCSAPPAMCELVHRMLDKDPSKRPMAVDVRRLTKAMLDALDDVALNDDIEITIIADEPETQVVQLAELEFGVTELLPTMMRKPRWTPQLEVLAIGARKPITPKNERDQVSGEIVSRRLLK